MRKSFLRIFLLLVMIGSIFSCDVHEYPVIDYQFADHPRILLFEGEEQQIQDLIDSDQTWENMHLAILEESNNILDMPTLERTMIGYRLLDTSRKFLKRIFYLSYAYRMTKNSRFMLKARDEMVAVSKFQDWNPSHFLDVAEITLGMAIGYDWLYDDLSNNAKYLIKEAIVYKGLKPSQSSKYNWFLTSSMNWNQVCNAGMVYGALAVQEDYPTLTKEIIDRAFESLPVAMEAYEPDGVYPEGYTYWRYGTSFYALFLSAIRKANIDDQGLAFNSGFLGTGHFLKHMLAPTGGSFNWGDCPTETQLTPAMFWFAEQTNDPSILWSEKKFLEIDEFSTFTSNRILPALMIWGKNIPLSSISTPKEKFWMGQGANPVAMMRSSWTDPNAMYLGFKAGTPDYVHAHMDVGSFVMEADGVRWATDLGKVVYDDLESLGMYIFGQSQDAERWTIFRMSTYAHNVLIIDDGQQLVGGYAKIDKYSDQGSFMYSVSDISSIYNRQIKKAVRGVGIVEGKYTIIRDEIETLSKASKVRWNMVTSAEVELGDKKVTLSKDGKTLYLKVNGPDNIQMQTWSTAPTNNYDPENPGTIMVGFECDVPAHTSQAFEVILVPASVESEATFLDKSLSEW